MQIYYRNLNPNDKDGVTGSCAILTVKRDNLPDYNCMVDFGMVQNSKLSLEQLYKLNGRKISIGGVFGNESVEIKDILISHSHA